MTGPVSSGAWPWRVRSRRLRWMRPGVLGLAFCAMIGFLWSFLVEPARLVERDHILALPHWPHACDGLRLDVVSDIHTGSWRNGVDNLDRMVSRLIASDADAVLLAGDYMILGVPLGTFVDAKTIAAHLRPLTARKPVYAVLGNHDWWKGGPQTSRWFGDAGIRMLDNRAQQIVFRECRFWIAGLGDLLEGEPDIAGTFATVPQGAPVIALTHEPDLLPRIPSRAALTIAGHTHGGQIDPWPFRRPNARYIRGSHRLKWLVRHRDRLMFVTPGIGTSILPLRFGATPEISRLTLRDRSALAYAGAMPMGEPPMSTVALVLIVLVALLHVYFLVLEMFLWTKPLGLKVFRNTPEKAEITRVLAANQGLYNGFLAAGLLWAGFTDRQDVAVFFLGCVIAAAVYGAYSVNKRIFIVQGIPAIAALAALLLLK
ncbi:MAG: DUF1304 family protein [Lysobacteraceae bacterium]|nr:MAG: DUF1304 family protein [Xanthomonadaceae bacterium]